MRLSFTAMLTTGLLWLGPVGAEPAAASVPREDLLVWLRADTGVHRTAAGATAARVGEPVLRWANGGLAALGDARADEPEHAPQLVNTRQGPALRFRAAGDRLRIAHDPRLDPAEGGFTVFVVLRQAGGGGILAKGNVGSSTSPGFNLFTGVPGRVPSMRVRAGIGGSGGRQRAGVHYTESTGGTGILTARFTGGQVIAAWNNDVRGWNEGGAGPTDSHYDGRIASAEDLLIGSYMDIQGAEETDIHEVLIYGRELALAERLAVTNYLARKYRVTVATREQKLGDDLVTRERAVVRAGFVYDEIEAPFAHAATLAETPEGLVAAWFAGTREGREDVAIWSARFDGRTWSEPKPVADGRRADGVRPCWNPTLFQVPGGPLLLFYKSGYLREGWWGHLSLSHDGGRTWSESRRLPAGFIGPAKNKPLLMPDGALLLPHPSPERIRGVLAGADPTRWEWEKLTRLNDGRNVPVMQPAFLLHRDGRLQMLCRSRSDERRIVQAWSQDGGTTWSRREPTELPSNNSGIDAQVLADGRLVLVYNPTTEHARSLRTPLSVALSPDGERWYAGLDLETGFGEYSYPAVIQSADGLVHVAYSWRNQRIKHVVIDPSQLAAGPRLVAP